MTDNTRSDHIVTGSAGEKLVQTDWSRYEQPALGIVEAIAGIKDKRPTDLPPLGREVDVDALNSLLGADSNDAEVGVSFEYEGLQVTIQQSGSLVVESPTQVQ
ncbi:HalOD1 output domain-containing protein [Halovenus sp. HT40]|uniref:HalOD1 output domain-containing protein n=1 Tax=Halovenus sp. HT40 TaxID=3126691 RepID=UPI00300E9449